MIDMLNPCRAARVPFVLVAGTKVGRAGAVTIVSEWPFRIRHAEAKKPARLQDAKTIAE